MSTKTVETDHTIYLTDATKLASHGVLIDVVLPSGILIDLWVYESDATTSIDVRRRIGRDTYAPLDHVIELPSRDRFSCAAVVIKCREG